MRDDTLVADFTTLVGTSEIASRVEEMARDIVAGFGNDLLLLTILKNGLVFSADLMRALGRAGARVTLEAAWSTNGSAVLQGSVDLTGHQVLVVDAILDTGRTAAEVMAKARAAGAAEVRLAVLLDRPARQTMGLSADYTGFILPDRYVVGYGIDRNEAWRERSDVAAVD